MATITTIPTIVDITHYGGDTFTLEVKAAPEVTDGQVWNADIKLARDSDVVDASFSILPPPLGGGSAYLTLSSVDSARLVGTAPIITRRSPSGLLLSIQKYVGVWDCQVSHPTNPDPVRTLVHGTFSIEIDVTRPA
jgi:hypothetical protein